jgi:hypothetical protein
MPRWLIVTEEFIILFITQPAVYQDKLIAGFNKQTAHSPGAKIIVISRIDFIPDFFWNYTKHGTAV